MTTLIDLTPEKRTQCKGMWVRYQTPMGEHLAIYEGGRTLFEPGYGLFTVPLHHITPRPDLPRAWTPDGDPPAGEWVYANPSDKERMHVRLPDKNTTHRRWVGKWEQA